MNGNVTPIKKTQNWADTAKPFMHSLVKNLKDTVTIDDVKEILAKRNIDPRDFLINSCLATLDAITQRNATLNFLHEKMRLDATRRADELADLFDGYEPAILDLFKTELAGLETSLR